MAGSKLLQKFVVMAVGWLRLVYHNLSGGLGLHRGRLNLFLATMAYSLWKYPVQPLSQRTPMEAKEMTAFRKTGAFVAAFEICGSWRFPT